ncbi:MULTISPECIES: hypothetical protein, partial [unclassified Caballeronia]
CVAASAAEKRDYVRRFSYCQQEFEAFLIDLPFSFFRPLRNIQPAQTKRVVRTSHDPSTLVLVPAAGLEPAT